MTRISQRSSDWIAWFDATLDMTATKQPISHLRTSRQNLSLTMLWKMGLLR